MDRGTQERNVIMRVDKGVSTLLLLALLLLGAGCRQDERAEAPASPPAPEEGAGDNTAPAAVPEWLNPAVAVDGPQEAAGTSPADNTAADNMRRTTRWRTTRRPSARRRSSPLRARRRRRRRIPASPSRARSAPPASSPSAHKPKPAAAPALTKGARDASSPEWAKNREELVYRVDFIGITMGYARFRYQGKVSIDGKPAYHLNVRAWTSGVLSFIYPINETIDYYLDVESITPIRQEFTQRERKEDDVALYDQETGKITYRYRQSGKIRKEVTTVPSVYDPVSIAYYFRWKDLGVENRPRNMYGGRKVYQISSRILGNERIRTEHGEVDTIAVVPLIRRDGKPDDKGDLKIWFSNDERRVPVRLYAKFRKIKDWTLVGELMPPSGKSGG